MSYYIDVIKSKIGSPAFNAIYVSLLGLINGIAVIFIITKLYDVSFQSDYYLATSLASWSVILDFGLSQTLLYISHDSAKRDRIKLGVLWYACAACIFGMLLFVSYFFFAGNISIQLFSYLALFLLNSVISMFVSYIRAYKGESFYWRFRALEFSAYSASIIIFLSFGMGMYAMIVSISISLILNVYVIAFNFNIPYAINYSSSFKNWISFIRPTQLKIGVEYISSLIGMKAVLPLVSNSMGMLEVGQLGLAITLFSIPLSMSMAVFSTKLNFLVKSYMSNDGGSWMKIFSRAIFTVFLFFLIGSLIILLLIKSNIMKVAGIDLDVRLPTYGNCVFIFISNAVMLLLVFFSSWLRISKKDTGWQFILVFSATQSIFFYFFENVGISLLFSLIFLIVFSLSSVFFMKKYW
ncbi:hypothetical protein RMN64_10615 [Plesiomonas shigelloides]|uniref:hypothetical protein n=2 Tax=Plesiomonas shigelloides TaxID=703 RepID=UPI002884A75F|nr:hypothetical protein [Plesiomonas shigelloides]MDT1011871.1 hypothetical protein [Plesiomonas shigelloides]QLL91187.1 Wzx [Plesiomonas shigelloides]